MKAWAKAGAAADGALPVLGVVGCSTRGGLCWGTEGRDIEEERTVGLFTFCGVDGFGSDGGPVCCGEALELCEEGAAAFGDESGICEDGEEVIAGYGACPEALRRLALLVSV